MKKQKTLPFLAIAALTASLVGCDKKSDSSHTPATNTSSSAIGTSLKDAASAAATEVNKTAAEVKAVAEKTATDLTQQAQSLTATATSKAQEYIDKAKALVSERKYQDALSALKEIGNLSLSPEQQKAADDLKKAIQTAFGMSTATTNGGNAIPGLPNK